MPHAGLSRTKKRRMREKERMKMLSGELASLRQQEADRKEESNRSPSQMAKSQMAKEQFLDSLQVEQEQHQLCQEQSEVFENPVAVELPKPDQRCPNAAATSLQALRCKSSMAHSLAQRQEHGSKTDLDLQPDIGEKENQCLKMENCSLKEMVHQLQTQLAEERKVNEESEKKLQAMKVQADIFKNDSTILAYSLHEMTSDRNNLLNVVEEKHERIKEVRAMAKAKLRKVADQMEVRVYNEQVKTYRLQIERKELKTELDNLKAQLQDQKLHLTVSNFVAGIIDDVENEARQREAQSLNDEIQQLKDHVAKVEHESRLQQQHQLATNERLHNLTHQYEALKQSSTSHKENNRTLSERIAILNQGITKAQENLSTERRDRKNAQTSFLAQIGQLKEDCASLKTHNTTLTKDGESLRNVVEAKNKEVASLKAVIDEMKRSAEEKEHTIEQLQSRKRRGCFSRLLCWR